MLETFTADTFRPYIGDTFRIHRDVSQPLDTSLIEVTELGRKPAGAANARFTRAPFSIVFRGPRDILLPQRIYRIEHNQIGTFDLFLVPIGSDSDGLRYEAVFN